MAYTPRINATVKITCKDINNNSVAKQFNQVLSLSFDYNDGTVNIVDVTGSFIFGLTLVTSLSYTIVTGLGGQHTVVAS